MENRERTYWNIVKGIAIFLMLWGHCIQYCTMDVVDFFEDWAFKTIYSFHMPLFMFVSGYLYFFSFQKRDLKTLLVHRMQGMLQPIVFCTILCNILMLFPTLILSNQIEIFFGKLFEGTDYTFWFLWSVLSASLAVGIACKITSNRLLQAVLCVLGVFFVALFPNWNMDLFMYPFFVVGFFCAMYRKSLMKIFGKLKYASFIVFPALLSYYELKHYIYLTPMYSQEMDFVENMEINVFRCGIGFAGIGFVLTVVSILIRLFEDKGQLPTIKKGIVWLGQNSLQLYCLSVPLLSGYLPHLYRKLMEPVGYNIFAQNMLFYDFLFTPLLTVLVCIGLSILIKLLKKMGVHYLLFGR